MAASQWDQAARNDVINSKPAFNTRAIAMPLVIEEVPSQSPLRTPDGTTHMHPIFIIDKYNH